MSYKILYLYVDEHDIITNNDKTDNNEYTFDNLPDNYDFVFVLLGFSDLRIENYQRINNIEQQILKNSSYRYMRCYNSAFLLFINVKIPRYSMYVVFADNTVNNIRIHKACNIDEIEIYPLSLRQPCIIQSCSDLTQNEDYANMKLELLHIRNYDRLRLYIATKREFVTKKAITK